MSNEQRLMRAENNIEVFEKQAIYEGHVKLFQYQLRFRLFSGEWSEIIHRECFQSHHAVGVLLIDPERDEIILIEQFRVGAYQSQDNQDFEDFSREDKTPWMLELIAGVIEPVTDESIEAVAKRESLEEAGCEILDLIPVCEFYTSPGVSTGKFSIFCGRIKGPHPGGIFGLKEEHEDIRVHVFPRKTVYDFVKNGRIHNAPTLIAVQWLMLNETKVFTRWK